VSAVVRTVRDIVRDARAARIIVEAPDDEVDLAEAYAIQAELFTGRTLVGYKLGLVSVAKQRQMGLASPIYGRVAADMLFARTVPIGAFIQPRCEPEVAIVLSSRLESDATPGAVARAVGAAFLAVDILDSVWSSYRFSLAQVVADGASAGGFLLGDRCIDVQAYGVLQLFLDGEVVAEGPVAAIGEWASNVAWLASAVGGLEAGMIVFLGAPSPAALLRPGLLELVGPEGSLLTARIVEAIA